MRVYDFDGTIYSGDSTRDFMAFCVRRHPSTVPRVPAALLALARFKAGSLTRDEVKERCLSVLLGIHGLEEEVEAFWDSHMHRIMPWYMRQAKVDDVIITASPRFIVSVPCMRIGLCRIIATDVDTSTMRLTTPNCRGSEKVRRLREAFPDEPVDEFYSDSNSDEPMARVSRKAFTVRRGRVVEWNL